MSQTSTQCLFIFPLTKYLLITLGVDMKKNVGGSDKIARYILGAGIIGAGIYFNSWWGVIGIVPIFTALMGWCPFYVPIKISTDKSE
jgi:hypothetical protein